MVLAGTAALRATGHGGDEMLLGETGPIGRITGALATRPVAPRPFLRTLLCLDGRTGTAAAVRGCARRGGCGSRATRTTRTRAAARGRRGRKGKPATEITIASSGGWRSCSTRRPRAAAAGASCRSTTRSTGSRPTRPTASSASRSPARREYLNQSDWMAFGDPRVRTVAQYKLADDRAVSGFQSGLRFGTRAAKPAYDAYRARDLGAPARARRACAFCGPGAAAGRGGRQPGRDPERAVRLGDFRTVAAIDVRARNGTFVRTLPRREGRFRLRWGSVLSREASIAGE